jgi:DNA-binding MarR family transcriptional regulator
MFYTLGIELSMANREIHETEEALVVFFDAYRRSRARLQQDPHLAQLTLSEFAVLRAVAEHGADGVSRIARAAEMAQPPATRALDRLANKGLLRRRDHSTDARVTAVTLTPAGRRLLSHHRHRLRAAASLIAERLGPTGIVQAPTLLRTLAEAFEEASI